MISELANWFDNAMAAGRGQDMNIAATGAN